MKEVVLGLSGGVDSAVSARLLQDAGYRVHGLYLDIGTAAARADAGAVADALGIGLRVLDIAADLERAVCAPFAASYLRGETPNPCILCNPAVKFRALLAYADELGALLEREILLRAGRLVQLQKRFGADFLGCGELPLRLAVSVRISHSNDLREGT